MTSSDPDPAVTRRRFLGVLGGTLGALGPLSCGDRSRGHSHRRPWNVLYITADDLAPRLGCYGHPQVVSPHIDAFAREALLFESCYCQMALCTPSRTSILTGVRPSTSGLVRMREDWAERLPGVASLPRHFRNHGYDTYSIGKIFDPRSGPGDDPWSEQGPARGIDRTREARAMMRRAQQRARPFFLAIGFRQTHCPWNPTRESLELYDLAAIEPEGPGRMISNPQLQDCTGAGKEKISEAEAREITRRYFASVTDLDRLVHEVLSEARALGWYENTVIVFWCGDHGSHLGENGFWGKWTNYRACTRVPLVMRIPGMSNAGEKAPGIVESVDLYPTLVDLCDLPPPAHELEGLSFEPLFRDPRRPWKKAAFSQWMDSSFSVKTDRYDYIEDSEAQNELFDFVLDPDEERNLLEVAPETVASMKGLLTAGWRHALPEGFSARG